MSVASTFDFRVRAARAEDAADVARLSGELGYPASAAEIARRLASLLPSDRQFVAVAEAQRRVAGWLHAELRVSLESGERAEIVGLVVAADARRLGIGRELVAVAAAWARRSGSRSLAVRSNAARDESHPFYESLGFERTKTQHVYVRPLVQEGGEPACVEARE